MILLRKVKCNITACKHTVYGTNGITGKSDGTYCSAPSIELEGDVEEGTLECLTFKHKDDKK